MSISLKGYNKQILAVLFFIAFLLTGCSQNHSDNNENFTRATESPDKIVVVHFHATQQCWSCITVGKYALKTIKEKFSEEYSNGLIEFKDINGELPINRDMVIKYQARGSSLYVNTIIADQDNIKEDTAVWRLVNNENQFILYFEGVLKNLLVTK